LAGFTIQTTMEDTDKENAKPRGSNVSGETSKIGMKFEVGPKPSGDNPFVKGISHWSASGSGRTFFSNQISLLGSSKNFNCVSFESIFEKVVNIEIYQPLQENLESLLCTTFVCDLDWFISQIPEVPTTLVLHWNKQRQKVNYILIDTSF
jgi:hypothetical protein